MRRPAKEHGAAGNGNFQKVTPRQPLSLFQEMFFTH
jgi:hypothetical protein